MHALTLDQANHAIDHGLVHMRMLSGKLWVARRNGRTQTWKTRPGDFRIPIKIGFRGYGELTHHSDTENGVEQDGRIVLL
jgi:hypothetical protein